MASKLINTLQNAIQNPSALSKPEVKDTTYQKKLNYFTQNSENLYKKYGQTEYNRYLKYYTTKASAEKYGIDQNTIAPSYSRIDDLITNRQKYESQYGKSGYNTLYSTTYNLNKDEISTLNDAISLKEKGSYSADLLTDEMKTKFKYTDDSEDILRQKLGYVPKSFDSYAKKLVADAKATKTPEQKEAELTAKQNASYWDSIDTGEKETITEQQVKDAINILNGVAVVDPKAAPLSTLTGEPVKNTETTSTQTKEDTEQDAKVKKLEQEIKELEIQKMKANRESYSSSDNSAFMQTKANYDAKVAELETLRKSYTDGKKAKEQAYYSNLKNADDFAEYVAKGKEQGGFLEAIKNVLPSLDNIEHQKALEQITDEEKNTYNYLLGKQGEEASKKYLKSIMEDLNARYGSKVAEMVPDDLLSAMTYSGKAGLDQFVQGTSQLFTSEALPTSGTQYASSQIREGLGGVGKVVYDIGTTSANMMPSILLSSLTGGAGGLLGSATLGASAGGTAYNQALKQGYTEEQARSYGIMTGVSEGALQYLLGGVTKLGGKLTTKAAANAIAKIDNVGLKVAAKVGANALSEAGEEYLQEILTPIVRNVTLDENNEFKPFTEEALYSAMLGAITGGIFSGGDVISNIKQNKNTAQTLTAETQQGTPVTENTINETPITEQPVVEQEIKQQPEQLKFEETTPIEQQTVSNNTKQQPSPFAKTNIRKGAQTMANVAAGTEIGAKLQEDIYDGVYGYTPESSKTDVDEALKEVKANPTGLLSVTDILDRNQEIKRYGKKDIALADALWLDALERNDQKAADHYAAISADMKTIAGQTVQTGANISRLTPEGFVIFAQRQLARMNAEGKIKFGEKWTDVGFTEEEQTAILKAPDADVREVELQKAMSRIYKELPSTNWDKFDQVHKIFMLSNPATLIRNFGGNAINRSVEAISKKVEGTLQLALSKEKRTVPLKLKQEYRDMANGAWENGGKQLFQSQGKYELTNKGTSSFTPVIKDKGIVGKSYNAYAKFIVEKMESGDTYFAKPAYETALARYLQARGLEKITPEATKYAMQEALEVTYRDFSKFADAWVKFQKSNVIGKASTFITPFVKTPTNIARRAFEYSEAGLLKTLTLDTVKLKKGKITADQYIKSLSRGITGTVGLTGLGYLLGSGILPFAQLTAGWSDNKKEKELQQFEGFQPYSLKIGDTYFSVAWAQPAITPVIVGAQIAQSVKDKTSILQSVDPIKGIEYLADALGDLTVFSGLKGAVSYSSGLWDSLGNVAVSGASQMIPSVVKKVAQTFDKTKYDVYNGSIPQQVTQQSIIAIPGAKELLKIIGIDADIAPQVDPFGNKKSLSDNVLVRTALNFLSPTNITTTSSDPVIKEINKLFNQIEDTRSDLTATDILPTVFSDTYIKDTTISKESVNISKTERANLKEKAGQSIYRILGAYMNSPVYKIDDIETKVTKIKKIYKEMWTATKADLIKSKIPSVPKIK